MPPTVGLPQGIPARLIEGAVDEMRTLLRAGFNENLKQVYAYWRDLKGPGISNVPAITSDHWYVSEAVTPLEPPAGFIIGVRSEHDLTGGQNIAKQKHTILVSVVGYEVETSRLTRMAYRYGTALWMTLHDANTATCKILVRSFDYSPIYGRGKDAGQRKFSKDVTLACEVMQYERF